MTTAGNRFTGRSVWLDARLVAAVERVHAEVQRGSGTDGTFDEAVRQLLDVGIEARRERVKAKQARRRKTVVARVLREALQ